MLKYYFCLIKKEKMNREKYQKFAIFLIMVSIILGALASHYFKEILSDNHLNSFKTGIKYQFLHGISLLFLSLNIEKFDPYIKKSLNIMIIGVCLFSFSIYLLSIQKLLEINLNFLGPITPTGGVLLIISWTILFFCVKKID